MGDESVPVPEMPTEFLGSAVTKEFEKSQFPSSEDLSCTLKQWGVPIEEWGKGNTKAVAKFWRELKEDESGLEVWQKTSGEEVIVRVTHVLRAKVSSPECYQRGAFLLNTWQQYGDGRKRIRNGLLSEKLTVTEMPLAKNLHDVCQRAVTEEEMQRVTDAMIKIGPGSPAPEYDPSYVCPLEVVQEKFIDHTIEIEPSKSYPGLMTVYHLYTVDIICSGMPKVDFNTLEFEHADKNGKRKLKYIHAWVWMPWAQIQRFLFEGSSLKEKKCKGSFNSQDDLNAWLSKFDLELAEWGKNGRKSVPQLFNEIETGSSHLEVWGKADGVPLVVRIVHLLQVKITSPELEEMEKFLFESWMQKSDSSEVVIKNRPMSQIMIPESNQVSEHLLAELAKEVVTKNLTYLADLHFRFDSTSTVTRDTTDKCEIEFLSAELVEHRTDLQDSPSYKNLTTMYHIYTVQVLCDGLPNADFTSISFKGEQAQKAHGWRWVSWHQTLDMLHEQILLLEKRDALSQKHMASVQDTSQHMLAGVQDVLGRLDQKDADVAAAASLVGQLKETLGQLSSTHSQLMEECVLVPKASTLPPSMVTKLEEQSLLSDDVVREGQQRRMQLRSITRSSLRSRAATEFSEADSPANRDSLPSFQERLLEAFKGTTMSVCDLHKVLKAIGSDIPEETIKKVLDAANMNTDGNIRYEDLVKWIL
eukprot:TRINITY_DN43977_c0_g1_i1.p1 TRINITY_DN43977_c0_g1~~TRINITY_DN43977_c0_g1_i1.p1  ORF type:complete len:699 (-),score=147.11 TRINITY_DN43977_c0_g1_i1:728-2824(-)